MATKFNDIDFSKYRHPSIIELENQFIAKQPANSLYFIKNWALHKLKEIEDSESDEDKQFESCKKQERLKDRVKMMRRRNAMVMAKCEQTQHWNTFYNKAKVVKNEECTSRIMIGLRSVPFLERFEWEDITYLVSLGQVREYYRNEIFASEGQMIDRLYIIISGEMKKNLKGTFINYAQGSYFFAETLISNLKAANKYVVESQKVLICGIDSYAIHQRLREVNKKREESLQRIVMNVGLFTCLDNEEMYKLVLMIKELPPIKKDQIVVEKDSPVNKIFLVVKGEFSLCRKNISGEITALHTYREGQFFEEEWIKPKAYSEVTAIAKTDGILNYIDRESIESGIAKIQHLVLRRKLKKMK